MSVFYAQINSDGICIGKSALAGEIEREDMIILTEEEFQSVALWDVYSNGFWQKGNPPTPPPPELTPEQIRISELEANNADLHLQLAQTNTDMAGFMDFVFQQLGLE